MKALILHFVKSVIQYVHAVLQFSDLGEYFCMYNDFSTLVSVWCSFNSKLLIFKLISRIDILGIACALRWMSTDFTGD